MRPSMWPSTRPFMRPCIAEALGSFMLVLAGTGAIVVNDISGGALGHGGVALCFGLVVLTVIYTYGDVSGAHINPAVTIAFWRAGQFPTERVPPYIASQLTGATCASLFLAALFPEHSTLGATLPAGELWQSFVLEVVLTWWLMSVVLGVSEGAKEKGIVAGLVIGAVVALEAMFAGPISGASMNPARSFGPALASGQLQHLWLYLTAPVLGALLAVYTCRLTARDECCRNCGAGESTRLADGR